MGRFAKTPRNHPIGQPFQRIDRNVWKQITKTGNIGISFKGSGFYLTDYAKKSKNNKSSDNTKKSAKKKTVKESTKS